MRQLKQIWWGWKDELVYFKTALSQNTGYLKARLRFKANEGTNLRNKWMQKLIQTRLWSLPGETNCPAWSSCLVLSQAKPSLSIFSSVTIPACSGLTGRLWWELHAGTDGSLLALDIFEQIFSRLVNKLGWWQTGIWVLSLKSPPKMFDTRSAWMWGLKGRENVRGVTKYQR